MMSKDLPKNWKPLSLEETLILLNTARFPWWIVGGLAVELAVGRPLRSHGDIDVLILRRDCSAVRQFLKDWDCWTSDPTTPFGSWPLGKMLPNQAHDIWCRKEIAGSWCLDLKVDESRDLNWYSRRDSRVTLPLAEFGRLSAKGIPYVTPEVMIYYKAKTPRPRDEIDFNALLPILNLKQRDWVSNAIHESYGGDHSWLTRLRSIAKA